MNIITDSQWTVKAWDEFTEQLKDALKKETVYVVFTKTDGTERKMKCTLNPEVLPKQEVKEDKKTKAVNTSVLPVYDLEVKAWRSFKITSIKKVSFEE
jgi:hypothetical protein